MWYNSIIAFIEIISRRMVKGSFIGSYGKENLMSNADETGMND
jgi:hypothetical protein